MFINCLAVGAGGFIGSILRYLVGSVIPSDMFPWGTLAINVVGSFALALIAGLVFRGAIDNESVSLMLRVGLCGGFTTMSTFSLEVVNLATRDAWLAALGYAVLTCVLCVAAAYAGGVLAKG